MVIGTFHIPKAKAKVVKTRDGTDVAARYFVYKIYEFTDGQPTNGGPCVGWTSHGRPSRGRSSADGSFSRAWAASRWNGRPR